MSSGNNRNINNIFNRVNCSLTGNSSAFNSTINNCSNVFDGSHQDDSIISESKSTRISEGVAGPALVFLLSIASLLFFVLVTCMIARERKKYTHVSNNRQVVSHEGDGRDNSNNNNDASGATKDALRNKVISRIFPQETIQMTDLQYDSKANIFEWINKKSNHNTKDVTCSICLEGYELGDSIVTLGACSHVFHRACIVGWATRRKTTREQCPICRQDMWNQERFKELEEDINMQSRRAVQLSRTMSNSSGLSYVV